MDEGGRMKDDKFEDAAFNRAPNGSYGIKV